LEKAFPLDKLKAGLNFEGGFTGPSVLLSVMVMAGTEAAGGLKLICCKGGKGSPWGIAVFFFFPLKRRRRGKPYQLDFCCDVFRW
jgi:hypothetical protein